MEISKVSIEIISIHGTVLELDDYLLCVVLALYLYLSIYYQRILDFSCCWLFEDRFSV